MLYLIKDRLVLLSVSLALSLKQKLGNASNYLLT